MEQKEFLVLVLKALKETRGFLCGVNWGLKSSLYDSASAEYIELHLVLLLLHLEKGFIYILYWKIIRRLNCYFEML